MTYTVSGGALNSTQSNPSVNVFGHFSEVTLCEVGLGNFPGYLLTFYSGFSGSFYT